MVDLKYVKKKRRKKIAVVTVGTSAALVGAFATISFLGSRVGSYTTKLSHDRTSLTLLEYKDQDPLEGTTYQKFDNLPIFTLWSSVDIQNHDQVDSETTDYLDIATEGVGSDSSTCYFFKHTFYLKNNGVVTCGYKFTIRLSDNVAPAGAKYDLSDILRVRLYENVDDDAHEYVNYARHKLQNTPVWEEEPYRECVSVNPRSELWDTLDEKEKFATSFVSDTVVLEKTVDNYKPGDITRYTVVFWLEGEDPQCDGSMPTNGSIKLGVEINGYEQETQD